MRICFYSFRSDQEFHRVNIFNDLPDLLKDNYDQCMERIVPKVLEVSDGYNDGIIIIQTGVVRFVHNQH